ncbi:LexA family protein [Hyalangium versicolor]|uniref:LexA family protein n=1 Tax=Hyalangium versicolor TaxID=2861190 RepID=UPI001CCB9AD1|nr:hypothetical protein [Hyalangium versicolor]
MNRHRRRCADLPPTERQLQVLRLIEEGRARQGYSPTVRELLAPLGVSSTQAVQCLVEALRRKGLLVGERGSVRTLRGTEAGRQCLAAATHLKGAHRQKVRALEVEVLR